MAAPDPFAFEALPPSTQYAINAGIFAVVVITAGWRYLKKLTGGAEQPKPPSEFVVQAATLADMAPVRDLGRSIADMINELRGVRHATEAVLAHLQDVERERDEDRRVERRVKEELVERAREIGRDSRARRDAET